jgi:hypothetical protein
MRASIQWPYWEETHLQGEGMVTTEHDKQVDETSMEKWAKARACEARTSMNSLQPSQNLKNHFMLFQM